MAAWNRHAKPCKGRGLIYDFWQSGTDAWRRDRPLWRAKMKNFEAFIGEIAEAWRAHVPCSACPLKDFCASNPSPVCAERFKAWALKEAENGREG